MYVTNHHNRLHHRNPIGRRTRPICRRIEKKSAGLFHRRHDGSRVSVDFVLSADFYGREDGGIRETARDR